MVANEDVTDDKLNCRYVTNLHDEVAKNVLSLKLKAVWESDSVPLSHRQWQKCPLPVTQCELLRSSAGSRDTKNHLRAAVQLDILLGA